MVQKPVKSKSPQPPPTVKLAPSQRHPCHEFHKNRSRNALCMYGMCMCMCMCVFDTWQCALLFCTLLSHLANVLVIVPLRYIQSCLTCLKQLHRGQVLGTKK